MSLAPPLAARLAAVAHRQENRVRLHERRAPAWTVTLSDAGEVLHVLPHPKPPRGETPHTVLAPREAKGRSNNVAPLLLTDNGQYVLGLAENAQREEGSRRKHAAYLTLLGEAAAVSTDLALVRAALPGLSPAHFPSPPLPGDLITFTVAGRNPHEDPAVQAFWITRQDPGGEAGGTDSVTGEPAALARNAPVIGKLPGGRQNLYWQSLNGSAFGGYGLDTLGASAATLQDVTTGLKVLLAGAHTAYTPRGADFTLLHWLSDPGAHDPWGDLNAATPEYVHGVLTAAVDGGDDEHVTVDVTVLGESGARLMVLDHAQLPLSEARRHAAEFRRLSGGVPLWQLERALRDAGDHADPRHLQALTLLPLTGQPLPPGVTREPLRRFRASPERRLPPEDRALLTLALRETLDMQSFDAIPEPLQNPYALGHYAATAHRAHRRLNPGVSRTVIDRHFDLLATQPARAYGLIGRELRTLLAAERRVWLRDSLTADLGRVSDRLTLPLPALFTPDQQSAFALGHDHAVSRMIGIAQEQREARESGT